MVTSVAHLVRTTRTGRDESAAARRRPSDPHSVRHLARGVRRLGPPRCHAVGILLDEVAGRLGPACPDGRSQHDHHRPGVLPAQQPLPAGHSVSFTAHLGNKYLPLGIGAVVVLQLSFTYAPPLQQLFDNEAIPLWVWPWLIVAGLVFFLV